MQQINGRQYDRDGGKNPDAVEKARQAYEKFERLHPQLPMVRNTHRHDAHSRYCGRRRIENLSYLPNNQSHIGQNHRPPK